METTSSISDTRKDFPSLVSGLVAHGGRHLVTKNGKDAAVVLSADEYESLIETLNILVDVDTMDAVTLGRSQIAAGDVVNFEDL